MGAHMSLGWRAGTVARWPVGMGLAFWRYLWRTMPLHRSDEEGSLDRDLPPPLPDEFASRPAPAAGGRVGPAVPAPLLDPDRWVQAQPRGADGRAAARAQPGRPGRGGGVPQGQGGLGATGGRRRVRRPGMPGPWDGPVGGGRPDPDLVPVRHPRGPPGGRADRVPHRPRRRRRPLRDRVVGPQRRPALRAPVRPGQAGQGDAAAHVDPLLRAGGQAVRRAHPGRNPHRHLLGRGRGRRGAADRPRGSRRARRALEGAGRQGLQLRPRPGATTTRPRTAGRWTTTSSRSRPSRPARRCRTAASRSPRS